MNQYVKLAGVMVGVYTGCRLVEEGGKWAYRKITKKSKSKKSKSETQEDSED